jgi:hypothetical protein
MEVLFEDDKSGDGGKDLYMKGIFIEGGVENHNKRMYPVNEIAKAVSKSMNKSKAVTVF